jgi:hypothetical protein
MEEGLQRGITLAQKAVEKDEQGAFKEAISLYASAVETFLVVMRRTFIHS